jgi:hypothetical protein
MTSSTSRTSIFKVGAICGLLALAACTSGGSAVPSGNVASGGIHTLSGGPPPGGGGGGTGGGGTVSPIPSPTVDGPAAYLESFLAAPPSAANNLAANFDALQPGGIPQSQSRSAEFFVFNISKKTPLTFSGVSIVGANPGDFTIASGGASAVLATTVAPNKGASVALLVAFQPTAEGVRTATLQVTTNAGILNFLLSGTGLPNRPIVGFGTPVSVHWCTFPNCTSAVNELTSSAPWSVLFASIGGQSLTITSLKFIGADPTAFTNHSPLGSHVGAGPCFEGETLAPFSSCGLSLVPTGLVPAPASATLQILTNDPLKPEVDVDLTLTP